MASPDSWNGHLRRWKPWLTVPQFFSHVFLLSMDGQPMLPQVRVLLSHQACVGVTGTSLGCPLGASRFRKAAPSLCSPPYLVNEPECCTSCIGFVFLYPRVVLSKRLIKVQPFLLLSLASPLVHPLFPLSPFPLSKQAHWVFEFHQALLNGQSSLH